MVSPAVVVAAVVLGLLLSGSDLTFIICHGILFNAEDETFPRLKTQYTPLADMRERFEKKRVLVVGGTKGIGRGFATSIHGGAVETALDEATAECAKAKLFPVATTVKIEFKIGKRVMPQVSYLVECEVTKEWSVNLKYDVSGSIKEADGSSTLATCVAVMANPAQIPGAGYE